MTSGATLHAVRRVRAMRTGAGAGMTPYTLYLVVMLALIVLAPAVRSLVLALAEPPVVAVLRAPSAASVIATAFGFGLAGMLLLGGVRGPALVSPFLTVALAGNDLPRHVTLRAPLVRVAAVVVAFAIGGAAILSGVLADAGAASVPAVVAFAVGTILSAVLLVAVWLLGQRLPRPIAARAAAAVVAATVVAALVPLAREFTPWGWAAALYPVTGGLSAGPPWIGLAALAALAGAGVAATRPLLDGLAGPALLEQARRWQTVGAFGAVGDLASALAQFRPVPALGRRWQAIRSRPLVVTFVVRDFVGAIRTPARFAVAVGGLASGAYALAAVDATADAVAWLPAVAGSLSAYLALGVWTDGFRHAVETSGHPTFYGVGRPTLLALHATFPLVSVLLVAGAGGAVAVAVHGPTVAALSAVCCPLFLVTVRLCDAAKGPMPPSVLTPIPTPVGDASGLTIAFWQADALLVGPAVAAGVATWAADTGWALAALVPAAAAAVLLTRSRLRR